MQQAHLTGRDIETLIDGVPGDVARDGMEAHLKGCDICWCRFIEVLRQRSKTEPPDPR